MKEKAIVLDEKAIKRTLTRIAHEIIEKNKGVDDVVLIGIKTRGIPLSKRIGALIEMFEEQRVPIGIVDIAFYRDDLTMKEQQPVLNSKSLSVDIHNKKVVIIDDVLYTGRTARAAIEAVFDHGRPNMIQLAVLVDRGHRELPIRADYVGKNIPTSKTELVSVKMKEIDGEEFVKIYEMD